MTSSPGLLQHRNSASSTPKINLCREVLYPPPLGWAHTFLPMSSSVAGTEPVWKLGFSCSQAACPAGWSCLWAAALLSSQPWHRDAVVEQGWFALPAPFVCWGFVGCSEPWFTELPNPPPLPKGATNPSLMDGKWHHGVVLVLSRLLAPNIGQHQCPKDAPRMSPLLGKLVGFQPGALCVQA